MRFSIVTLLRGFHLLEENKRHRLAGLSKRDLSCKAGKMHLRRCRLACFHYCDGKQNKVLSLVGEKDETDMVERSGCISSILAQFL